MYRHKDIRSWISKIPAQEEIECIHDNECPNHYVTRKKKNKTKHHRHLLVSFVKWKWFWNLLLSSLQYSFKRPSHQKTHLHFWVKWKLLFNGSHKFQHYISTRKKCIYLSIGPVTVNKKSYLTKQDGIFNKYQCMQYCSCWKMISLLPQSSKK